MRYTLKLLLFLCLLLQPANCFSEEYHLDTYDYYLNIPISWKIYSAEMEEYVIFTDSAGQAVFQVQTILNAAPDADPAVVCQNTLSGLQAEIEAASFFYNGYRAAYGNVRFLMNKNPVSGLMVCIALENSYVLLFAYAPETLFPRYMPLLLSCIDGFSYSAEGLRRPGPVSQFYYPFPGPEKKVFNVPFQEGTIPFLLDPGELDASQVMIEREARILADLNKLNIPAWKRYYRMIYRDASPRILPFAKKIEQEVSGKDGAAVARQLLAWLQSFTYLRTGTVSDLQSPLQSLLTGTGDCDSLGLLFCTIANYIGIDSILLVSSEYAHSIIAVDVPGAGARIPFEGTNYLVGELTDNVDIGLIDSQMADPDKWIPISFQSLAVGE